MFISRLFLSFAVLLWSFQASLGQIGSPSPRPEKSHVAAETAPIASPGQPQVTFNSVHVDGPYIALTFDDGPNATLTPKLLELLAAHQMHATFFVVGQNAADHPDILRRALHEGQEIANHSWSHPNLGKMSDESVRPDLHTTDD